MGELSSGGPDEAPGDRVSELRDRLAFSQLVMEHAADAIFLLNDEGRTVYANPAAERMFGYSAPEFEGLKLHDVIHDRHPDGSPYPMENCPLGRVFFSGLSLYSHEDTFFHKDGRPVPVACSNAPVLRAGAVEGGVLIVRDISDARRAQQALAESEARFRNMADSAPVMMWVTDAGGHCTYLNRRWYEFTGQAPGQGEGLGWLDAVHPEDREIAEQAFHAANARRRDYRVDFRLRRADGAYRWTIDAAAARFGENGEYLGYVGSVIDIEERREAEDRLALSEEQLRLATESAEIGLWDVDARTDAMFWPPRVKAMFGISPEVPVTLADFPAGVHPDDRPAVSEAFEAARDPARRALYDVEYRTVGREDGLIRWVAAKGRGLFTAEGLCTRVIGTAIDITARKADEVRLRDLNEQLEQRVAERTAERNRIWEMSHDLFAIMGFDGYLKAINPAWEATLGFDEATLLAMDFPKQVHPDDHGNVAAMMEQLSKGETVRGFEDRLRHVDGSWRWISWTLVPQGEVFYAVGRDVSAEREAAAELERAQGALRQSQKMEAMGQLTGGVAHDFNNLLTPIVGSLDMLQRKGLGGPREQRLIDGAMQSADRAKTLVQRLLAFARRQPLQPSAVDVGRLVAGMADLIASTSGPQIHVVVDAADGLPPAKADPNQLEMALLNLGVNARDAMPEGGTLRITAGLDPVGPDHRSGLRPGPYVRLSVADTGIGMDEATVKRAVEPFFSTKGIGKGTGLGLSMVHGLASQLGGALNVESRLGVGTNIELWLPASDVPVDKAELAVAPSAVPSKAGTALLVDDEELVRESTADMLEDLGYEVVQAASAEEALRLVRGGLRPDVLMTDHLMPGMNGTELANVVRADLPGIPVLIVSGYAEADGIAPHFPRLVKPFRNSDLAGSLAELGPARLEGPEPRIPFYVIPALLRHPGEGRDP
ncbi:MAG TPA: PAS domain S-box protein [Allosphingosinicella sp.]|jgi:PAS domain S-box-containing protein